MDEADIQKRARAGEDSRTEFKRVVSGVLPDSDDVSKALVALANSGGGEVLFGIADDGSIEGVGGRAGSDALQRHVAQIAATAISPPLPIRLLAVEASGSVVVVAQVPEFLPERPFRGRTKYFVRDGPSSREARPDELKRLIVSAPIHYLDEQVIDRAERAALDDTAIAEFLRTAYASSRPEEAERYLHALHAVDAGTGRPTVTGVLLFARDPSEYLVGAYVSAIRFEGSQASGKFLDSAEVRGPVFRQIEDTVAFLTRSIAVPSEPAGLHRVQSGVPIELWREAVTNAVTHREYASPNQIRVFVFEDRVEISNPGELLNRLTVENIRLAGTKQPRNPHVASAVARARFRDNIGIGVPEIFRMATERGFPEPEIHVDAGEFRLTIFTRARE